MSNGSATAGRVAVGAAAQIYNTDKLEYGHMAGGEGVEALVQRSARVC